MKTQKQKLAESHAAYTAAKTGTRPRTQTGSIPTHPVVSVPNKSEAKVLAECIKWLKSHRVFHNRHDCGAGDLGHGFATYGIKGSGDIHGILHDGRHFEIECKRGGGGRLSEGQQSRMAGVRATNGLYFVVHGKKELEYCMKELV